MSWQQVRKARSSSIPYPFFSPPPDDPAEYFFKVLVLGDTSVGKTSFVNRFCDDVFRENVTATIAIDTKKRLIEVDGKAIKLQVWDTAGQERFRTLTTAFYRGVTGIIILYDVTKETSFNHVTYWLEDIAQNVSGDICKVMVGNKSDCQSFQVVSDKRAATLANAYQFPFIEASARTGENVELAFEKLTRQMLASHERKMSSPKGLPSPTHSTIEKVELFARKKGSFSVCSC